MSEAEIELDYCKWWQRFGDMVGWRVGGWTGKERATFLTPDDKYVEVNASQVKLVHAAINHAAIVAERTCPLLEDGTKNPYNEIIAQAIRDLIVE